VITILDPTHGEGSMDRDVPMTAPLVYGPPKQTVSSELIRTKKTQMQRLAHGTPRTINNPEQSRSEEGFGVEDGWLLLPGTFHLTPLLGLPMHFQGFCMKLKTDGCVSPLHSSSLRSLSSLSISPLSSPSPSPSVSFGLSSNSVIFSDLVVVTPSFLPASSFSSLLQR